MAPRVLHLEYGPVVRINPHELHIMDPGFYQELYGDRKMDKYQWWCNLAGAPGSMFATVDAELYRRRRAVLNNFFSKKAVAKLEPLIREKIRILVRRFEDAVKSREIVRLDCVFMALTMDVICFYCFGKDRGYLNSPDFGKWWKELINGAWQKGALMRQFPWMPFLLRRFPRGLARAMDQQMGDLLAWQDSVYDEVVPILSERRKELDEKTTIFHTLRDSDLLPEEKSMQRLRDESEIFTGAGSETTARTLTTIVFYLLQNPDVMKKLRTELRTSIPHSQGFRSWNQLEQLPCLSAVVQEGLRLSYGITARLPRVSKEEI